MEYLLANIFKKIGVFVHQWMLFIWFLMVLATIVEMSG